MASRDGAGCSDSHTGRGVGFERRWVLTRPATTATAESSDSDDYRMRAAAATQLRSSRPAVAAGAAFTATASCRPAATRPSRAYATSCSNSSDSGDSPVRSGAARSGGGACSVNLDSSDSDDLDAATRLRAATSRARSTAAMERAARLRAAACHPQRGTARSGGGGACGVNLDSSDSDDSSVGAAARRPQHGTAHSGSGGSCGVKLVRDALGNPLVTLQSLQTCQQGAPNQFLTRTQRITTSGPSSQVLLRSAGLVRAGSIDEPRPPCTLSAPASMGRLRLGR
jgi:hypothetical protein